MERAKIIFLGDVSFSGQNRKADKPFISDEINEVFKNSDAVIANFESSVGFGLKKQELFQSDVTSVQNLKECGITHAFLANNHIYDYGYEGFQATVEATLDNGMQPVGLSQHNGKDCRITSLELNGIKIGLLCCGWTKVVQDLQQATQYWEYNEKEILSLIEESLPHYDHLILVAHRGKMFVEYPFYKDRKAFKKYLNLGLSAIVCHHPHVVQAVECKNGQLVAYSIGNFFFDSSEGHVQSSFSQEKQDTGVMISLTLSKEKLLKHKVIPVYKEAKKTMLLPAEKAESFNKHLRLISARTRSSLISTFFFSLQFAQFVLPHFIKVKLHHIGKSKNG
ncbi:MAG: CapA family protein [Roseivirga sp.]|nr:CapA family protein [Roseivirga sp.]